jgi:photosystem II stability/assembly factor-like uncharacterized protein
LIVKLQPKKKPNLHKSLEATMKTLLTFLLLAAAVCAASAQWVWQNPLPQGNHLTGIFFLDANNGWATGEHGTTIRTTNGGRRWQILPSADSLDPSSYFHSTHFFDENTGLVIEGSGCSEYGRLLRTTDGGSRWNSIDSPFDWIWKICFVDSSNWWSITYDTTLRRDVPFQTVDGGRHWGRRLNNSSVSYTDVYFFDRDNGWVFALGGSVYHTTNGGDDWTMQSAAWSSALTGIDFVDPMNGWVVAYNGGVLRTTNGGHTWVQQTIAGQTIFGSIQFSDASHGWVLCGTRYDAKKLFRTSNGGNTWNYLPLPRDVGLRALWLDSANKGWVWGGSAIFHTSNGGDNWEEQSTVATERNLNSVHFADRDNGWAVGDSGTIVNTSNNGTSWTLQQSGIRNRLSSAYCTNRSNAYAVGDSGKVLRTTNSGARWDVQAVLTSSPLYAIRFVGQDTGWIAGAGGRIFRTTNRGTQWVSQTSPVTIDLKAVFFRNRFDGWVAGGNVILQTNNGGLNWAHQGVLPYGNIESIQFVDAMYGWAYTGPSFASSLYKTTDGGNTWTQVQGSWSTSPGPCYFADRNKGWALGIGRSAGCPPGVKVLCTTNGGSTWEEQSRWFLRNLNVSACFTFADPNNGWLVGEKGMILHTSNGGVTFANESKPRELPSGFVLEQNYPNPFNPSTTITYQLPTVSHVALKVFDILGREVASLVDGFEEPGYKSVTFDASNLASGVYFYRLRAGEFSEIRRMLLVK